MTDKLRPDLGKWQAPRVPVSIEDPHKYTAEQAELLKEIMSGLSVVDYQVARWTFTPVLSWVRSFHHSPVCRLVHACAEGLRRCRASDTKLRVAARRTLKPQMRVCHAGLTDAIVPIVVEGRYLGGFMGGQVLLGPLTPSRRAQIKRRLRDLPLDEAELERAISDMPTVSKEVFRRNVKVVWEAVQLAVACAALRRDALSQVLTPSKEWSKESYVEAAKQYVRYHLDQPITLTTVCRDFIHKERCYFARIFRQVTGETFGQYVRRQKIERAKQLLASTHLPIRAIAVALAFPDLATFSKAFRRLAQMTPSAFRDQTISDNSN